MSKASIEERGNSTRLVWRNEGRKQHLTVEADIVDRAVELINARDGRISRDEAEVLLLGEKKTAPTVQTLRQWAPTWLDSRTRITANVRYRHGRDLERVILPALGDIPMDELRPSQVGKFLRGLRAGGLSPATVTRYYSCLHGVLRGAVDEGLFESNPAGRTDFVRDQIAEDDIGEEDRVYLTPEEYKILVGAFPEHHRPFLELLAGTGVRWGEATAIQVRDLRGPTLADPPQLGIRRAWKPAPGKAVREEQPELVKAQVVNGCYLGTTKGRQRRWIDLDDDLHLTLSLEAVVFDEDSGSWRVRADDEFLFLAPKGGPLNHSNFMARVWKPAVVRAARCAEHPPPDEALDAIGLTGTCGDYGGRLHRGGAACGAAVLPGKDRCRSHAGPARSAVSACGCRGVLQRFPNPHDMRHTHASWLFNDPSVPVLAISRRLGHANLQTTSEIYGGLQPTGRVAVVAAIASAMGRSAVSKAGQVAA